jgi:putative membrane protein
MNWLVSILVTWLVTSISLLIISKLPIGVEIDSFEKSMFSAAVFGILNAILAPVLTFLAFPLVFLTFGLFLFVINAAIFGLAAWLVQGFRLRFGFISALLGAFSLTVVNLILFNILETLGLSV